MNYELHISDTEVLHCCQRNTSVGEYVKVTCTLMLNNDCSVEFVFECSGIDQSTVYRYWKLYKMDGLDDKNYLHP